MFSIQMIQRGGYEFKAHSAAAVWSASGGCVKARLINPHLHPSDAGGISCQPLILIK